MPLVIDVMDSFSTFSGQCFKRIKFYQKNNYNIDTFNMTDTKVANKFKKKKEKKAQVKVDENYAGSDFLEDSN